DAGGFRRSGAHRRQAARRGGGTRGRRPAALHLVLGGSPRPAPRVPGARRRAAGRLGARGVLRVSSRLPRILAVLGPGGAAPTMAPPPRAIVGRLGDPTPRAVLLDPPYGFQENASEITQRAIEYFGHRVQLTIEPAGFLGPLAADQTQRTPIAEAAALSRVR